MLSPLYSTRRIFAGLALGVVAFQLLGFSYSAALAQPAISKTVTTPQTQCEEVSFSEKSVSTVTTPSDNNLLAHHGGDGVTGAVAIAGAPSVAAGMLSAHASKRSYSDSMWGNILLNMAFARDEELQRLSKRLGQINSVTMLSLVGVSGLSLAQGIYGFNHQAEPQSIDVIPAHHPGGHDHVHIPAEKTDRVPSTLSIVGSGVTIGMLGLRAMFGKAYTIKIVNRQVAIRDSVDSILDRLDQGIATSSVQSELVKLVGERASSEFLMLWRVVHSTNLQ